MAPSVSDRPQHTIGRVVGYHGCDLGIARRLLNNEVEIGTRGNEYDWLGDGAYFWVDSAKRGIEWAAWKSERGEISAPCVIGAFINLGLCLSLTDFGVMDDIRRAYDKGLRRRGGLGWIQPKVGYLCLLAITTVYTGSLLAITICRKWSNCILFFDC